MQYNINYTTGNIEYTKYTYHDFQNFDHCMFLRFFSENQVMFTLQLITNLYNIIQFTKNFRLINMQYMNELTHIIVKKT